MYVRILKDSVASKKAWMARSRNPNAPVGKQYDHMKVAETIIDQYGGTRFRIMTGASMFSASPASKNSGPGLTFRIPKAFGGSSRGVTHVKTFLSPDDTYEVHMIGVSNKGGMATAKTLNVTKKLYGNQLQEHFSNHTGLATHL